MKSRLPSFPFFTVLRIPIPLSEACLYNHINWSLAQAHQQSSLGFSQSSTSKRGARAKLKAVFPFNVQKQSVPEPSDASLVKKHHLDTKPDGHQGGRKTAGGVCTCSSECSKKGTQGGWWTWCVTVFKIITIILICSSGHITSKILTSVEKHFLS